jgi:RNA polymerase sigma-B factor
VNVAADLLRPQLSDRGTAEPAPCHRREELSDKRELAQQLFERMAALPADAVGRRSLRNRLVEMHIPLAVYFARRYTGRGEAFDDLVQAAAIGLVKAVDRFDPHRGVAFSTFAGPTILGELRRHFRDRTWVVHVYRSLQERTNQVHVCMRDLSQELGRSPTVAELAARAGLSQEQVLDSLTCSAAYRVKSLAAQEGLSGTLGDRLGGEDPEYERVETHEVLGAALARLPERDRKILQLRFFGNMSQVQIAERLGVSQMHISRLLRRSLNRLREDLGVDPALH